MLSRWRLPPIPGSPILACQEPTRSLDRTRPLRSALTSQWRHRVCSGELKASGKALRSFLGTPESPDGECPVQRHQRPSHLSYDIDCEAVKVERGLLGHSVLLRTHSRLYSALDVCLLTREAENNLSPLVAHNSGDDQTARDVAAYSAFVLGMLFFNCEPPSPLELSTTCKRQSDLACLGQSSRLPICGKENSDAEGRLAPTRARGPSPTVSGRILDAREWPRPLPSAAWERHQESVASPGY